MTTNTITKERISIPQTKLIKDVILHHVVLPNGEKGCWESIAGDIMPTVLLLGLTKRKEIITIEIFRFPVNDFCIELPGGTLMKDEDPKLGVLREFIEETGYKPKETMLLCKGYLLNSKLNQSFEVWLGTECRKVKNPRLDTMEQFAQLKVVKLSVAEIEQRILLGDINIDPTLSHALLALRALKI